MYGLNKKYSFSFKSFYMPSALSDVKFPFIHDEHQIHQQIHQR